MVKPSFGVYLPLNFPCKEEFDKLTDVLSECVDFFEIGIPSPKPKYDGPTIRVAHTLIASRGYPLGLEAVESLPIAPKKPSIVMGYLEDIGLGKLAKVVEHVARLGYAGLLLPDLSFDYPDNLGDYVAAVKRVGLRPAFFASSKFPHRWLTLYASHEPLFIYLGLQPSTGVELPIAVERNVRLARKLVGDTFLLVGFAVREPYQARRLIDAGADAVVVGSEVLRKVLREGVVGAKKFACMMWDAVHRR